MAFINTVKAASAQGDVRSMYERQEQHWGFVPNYAKVFSHRPATMQRWGQLLAEIKRPVNERRFELVTLAVALQLRHSACSLAHGTALARIIGKKAVMALAKDEQPAGISDAEMAIVRFARNVARDASRITSGEVAALRELHGLADEDVFDIVAIAAGRCFFTKVLDALGSEPDLSFMQLDEDLRRALTVGRPISIQQSEHLDDEARISA